MGLSGTRWDIKILLLFSFMLWSYRQKRQFAVLLARFPSPAASHGPLIASISRAR